MRFEATLTTAGLVVLDGEEEDRFIRGAETSGDEGDGCEEGDWLVGGYVCALRRDIGFWTGLELDGWMAGEAVKVEGMMKNGWGASSSMACIYDHWWLKEIRIR